jgi:gluconokinase
MVIILMGAAGAGKTTVGSQLSHELGWRFRDGDALHPPENIAKMARGTPLTDDDRRPWLQALRASISEWIERGVDAVLACSLLTRAYRAALLSDDRTQVKHTQVKLVYLRASRPLLQARLTARTGHFAGVQLLESQLALLEEPGSEEPVDTLVLDASECPGLLIETIRARWNL